MSGKATFQFSFFVFIQHSFHVFAFILEEGLISYNFIWLFHHVAKGFIFGLIRVKREVAVEPMFIPSMDGLSIFFIFVFTLSKPDNLAVLLREEVIENDFLWGIPPTARLFPWISSNEFGVKGFFFLHNGAGLGEFFHLLFDRLVI